MRRRCSEKFCAAALECNGSGHVSVAVSPAPKSFLKDVAAAVSEASVARTYTIRISAD